MKTVSMRRDSVKKDDQPFNFLAEAMGGSEHPLRLRISAPELKKLGIGDDLPKDGARYRIEGEAKIGGSDTLGGQRCVDLVITELGLEPKTPTAPDKTIRESLEDARHQARGTLTPSIGGRFVKKT